MAEAGPLDATDASNHGQVPIGVDRRNIY